MDAKVNAGPVDLIELSAKLSFALCAFTIEFDNAFEARCAHRTTQGPNAKSQQGPWLVSQPMWSNLLRHVGDGRPARVLRLGIETTNLHGLQRWGYIGIRESPHAKGDDLIFLKPSGLKARDVWLSLAGEIESRWRLRHGSAAIDELKALLLKLLASAPAGRPHHLPVLGYGLALDRTADYLDPVLYGSLTGQSDLSALFAQVLLSYQLGFEKGSRRALCVEANLLSTLAAEPRKLAELPRCTGLARPALNMAQKVLEHDGLIDSLPAGTRGRLLQLNANGRAAYSAYLERVAAIAARCTGQHGDTLPALDRVLSPITGPAESLGENLYAGIEPFPSGWRAALKAPRVLPRFPAVLHRGGFPDGA